MFDTPSAKSSATPAEPIDVDKKYLLKLLRLHNEGPSKFEPESGGPPPNRIRWEWHMLADGARELVMGDDGEPYVFYTWTTSRTGKGEKVATARKWMEALMGRDVDDSEIQPGFHENLIGKSAVAVLEENGSRISILRLSPRKKPTGQQTAPAPAPVRKSEPEYADDLQDVAF